MEEPAARTKTLSSIMPDWSQLHVELLDFISKKLDNCFDSVHARSVCSSWRSAFPFPSSLLRSSYSLPSFAEFPLETKGLCTLEKVPLFLFRLRSPLAGAGAAAPAYAYFLGVIGRDESDDRMDLPSPLQCSVKVEIPGSDLALMNILDCQIFPLGHRYRMVGWDPEERSTTSYGGVAFLPVNKDRGGEFVVLVNFAKILLVLRSSEMRWMQVKNFPIATCNDLVGFRGRFYTTVLNGDIFVIDPYSLEATPLMPLQHMYSIKYLAASGNDELFLVEKSIPPNLVLDLNRFSCRVSRLDEEAGKWVEVSDLGDRVLFIIDLGNVFCSAKEIPDVCGLSGNSILFTNGPYSLTSSCKYGVHTGRWGDDLNCWRLSGENSVVILSESPVVALLVEPREILHWNLDI